MTSLVARAARRIDGLPRYQPGAEGASALGKLSSNELYLGASPRVRAAIEASAGWAHLYQSTESLRSAIAAHVGTVPERVVPTSGSDELCYLLTSLLVEPGDGIVLGVPSYKIDEIVSQIAGAAIHRIPLRDGAHDLEAMAAACADARLVWLPTPHNPTGVAVDPGELERFLDDVPSTCLVVLDEAYRDFVEAEQAPDSVALLERYPNVAVQRTLSKAFGLAGIRVGYGLATPELIDALHALRSPFNVNSAALAAATTALDDPAWRDYAVLLIRRERDRLEALLVELGIEFWPSQANFVTIHVGDRWAQLRAALGDAGIAVRDGRDLGLPGMVRISIGGPAQMALVHEALQETFA